MIRRHRFHAAAFAARGAPFFIADDRHPQRLLDAILLAGGPLRVDVIHRRRQRAGRTAAQIDELLLHRTEQEARVAIAVGGDDVDAHHGVRLRQLFGRFEVLAVQLQGTEQHIRGEVRGEGERQAELRRQLCAVEAGTQQPERHVQPPPGTACTGWSGCASQK